jgi:UDP-N-acetylglucosamine 2-epimerase (non-hydrolysing)
VRLVLAGDGFERPELEALARRLGVGERTTFLGAVPNGELPRFYRAAAVSVIPSLEEGFGIPAAEAMGCEVPVIASDAGGLPEVVEDGVTGLVVPRGDVDALACALVRLLADADSACDGPRGAGGRWRASTGTTGGALRGALPPSDERPWLRSSSPPLGRGPPACMTDGVPRIREVCRELGVRNTFFVNLGRSTNLREWLGGLAKSKAKLGDRESIHLIAKIGWRRFLVETLRARPVGLSFLGELRALQAEGHELGLHGGMDHVVWSRRFELPAHLLEADVHESQPSLRAHWSARGPARPARRAGDGDPGAADYATTPTRSAARRARSRGARSATDDPRDLAGPRTIPFVEWQAARRLRGRHRGGRGAPPRGAGARRRLRASVLRGRPRAAPAPDLRGRPARRVPVRDAPGGRGLLRARHGSSRRARAAGGRLVIRALCVFGTRPEAIKMAPVVRALRERPARFKGLVCLTAQHRGLLDQSSRLRASPSSTSTRCAPGSLRPRSRRACSPSSRRVREVRPDVVLVQGDTTTTFATAFASFLERIPVGHVEAGLRTGNLEHPFPEELNRVLTTKAARLHFAPTEGARAALLAEGVPASDVWVTGNTVIDALLQTVKADYVFRDPVLRERDPHRRLVLVTTHRRESFGAPLASICAAVGALARRRWDCDFVIPVHPNPRVRATLVPALEGRSNVHLLEPLGYREFVQLMARAHLILTDSGGVQEEAPTLGVPVLVLRETTSARGRRRRRALVGTDEAEILRHALEPRRPRRPRADGEAQPLRRRAAAQRVADAPTSASP